MIVNGDGNLIGTAGSIVWSRGRREYSVRIGGDHHCRTLKHEKEKEKEIKAKRKVPLLRKGNPLFYSFA